MIKRQMTRTRWTGRLTAVRAMCGLLGVLSIVGIMPSFAAAPAPDYDREITDCFWNLEHVYFELSLVKEDRSSISLVQSEHLAPPRNETESFDRSRFGAAFLGGRVAILNPAKQANRRGFVVLDNNRIHFYPFSKFCKKGEKTSKFFRVTLAGAEKPYVELSCPGDLMKATAAPQGHAYAPLPPNEMKTPETFLAVQQGILQRLAARQSDCADIKARSKNPLMLDASELEDLKGPSCSPLSPGSKYAAVSKAIASTRAECARPIIPGASSKEDEKQSGVAK